MLRKFLVRIRYERVTNFKKFNNLVGIVFAISFISSILVDVFIPFGSGWNLIRTALILPVSISTFILLYEWSISLHDRQVEQNEAWQPFRLRYSRRIRRYISAVIAAFMFVFIYGVGHSPIYTFVSSLFVTLGIGLLAFMRPTRDEEIREELEIPDVRDIRYNNTIAELEAKRLKSRLEKKEKKEARSRRIRGDKKASGSDEFYSSEIEGDEDE